MYFLKISKRATVAALAAAATLTVACSQSTGAPESAHEASGTSEQALGEPGCALSNIVANGGAQCTYRNDPSDCVSGNSYQGTLSGSDGNMCSYSYPKCVAAGGIHDGVLDGVTLDNCWNYGLDNRVIFTASTNGNSGDRKYCPDQAVWHQTNSSGMATPHVEPATMPTDQATCNALQITTSVQATDRAGNAHYWTSQTALSWFQSGGTWRCGFGTETTSSGAPWVGVSSPGIDLAQYPDVRLMGEVFQIVKGQQVHQAAIARMYSRYCIW